MKVAARLTGVGIAALALAVTPGLAAAKSNHGLHCGRGHHGPTKAIGKKCDKSTKRHSSVPSGAPAAPSKPSRATEPNKSSTPTNTAPAQCRSSQGAAFGDCVSDKNQSSQGATSSASAPAKGHSGTS